MDLSINKINFKNNINFKGLDGAYSEETTPVLKFYAPAHKKDEKVYCITAGTCNGAVLCCLCK